MLATVVWAAWLVTDVVRRLPPADAIVALGDMANATIVYDAFDEPAFALFRERRLSVPLTDVSPHVIQAVIAIEDRRFFDHGGFDIVRIGGAVLADLASGRLAQGGSTITQQLARVSLLSRERTFRRKVAEVITARRIESAYAKDQILELYLNRIYFGGGFHGVEAASRGYFGKPSSDVTLGEAALLAGLIQAPSRYSPTDDDASLALTRRDVVLSAMLETGAADEASVERARAEPLVLENGLDDGSETAAYFKAEVRRRLIDRFGPEAVYGDGLHVYTTLVPAWQQAADEVTRDGLRRIEALPRFPHGGPDAAGGAERLEAALIAMDPTTGAVGAVVGGRRFADSPFNRATQARRQPGSAFKPILYAAALDNGLTPATRLTDLDRPVDTADGAWLPDDNAAGSAMTVRTALRLSSNRAAVRVLERAGIARAVAYADRFALGPQPPVPSMALGSGTVTLERLTAAYAAFANDGLLPRPIYIRRVERPDGETVYRQEDDRTLVATPVVTPATAYIVASLLRDVVDTGTGARVRREGFQVPAAGKTGTTDDYRDAWFVGFTPRIAAGVWIGFDRPTSIMPDGYASDLAAPLWARFMTRADATSDEWLVRPPEVVEVEVCALSGALASEACRRVSPAELFPTRASGPTYLESFAAGSEPEVHCPIHQERRGVLGRLADLFGAGGSPDPAVEDRNDTRAPDDVRASDASAESRVAVIHDHVFGSCRGWLVADGRRLRYDTAHHDAFAVSYAELDRFVLDGGSRWLRVRRRAGRHYNFSAAEERGDALAVFHATAVSTHDHLATVATR